MGQILHGKNGRYLCLIPRSGSHAIAAAWLEQYEPENYARWQLGEEHPARHFQEQISDYQIPAGAELSVLVRNPIERFRSMVAKHNLTLSQQLASPMYGSLPQLPFTAYFRFEDQLQDCANWLGITTALTHLDATDSADKPTLTPEQEARVRDFYAADMALWESLQ